MPRGGRRATCAGQTRGSQISSSHAAGSVSRGRWPTNLHYRTQFITYSPPWKMGTFYNTIQTMIMSRTQFHRQCNLIMQDHSEPLCHNQHHHHPNTSPIVWSTAPCPITSSSSISSCTLADVVIDASWSVIYGPLRDLLSDALAVTALRPFARS